MKLQDKLDTLRREFEAKRPENAVIMKKATADLIASGQPGRALKPGDRAPAFVLPGADGMTVNSADLLARGPLVVTFYRGVWCPYCNLDLAALQETSATIIDLGASLVALSPQTAANSRKAQRTEHLTFPILTDHGNEVAHQFGLRFRLPDELITLYKGFGNDLAITNGEPSWTLPMPARYVIGADGVIAYAEVNPDYTRRPDPEEMLPALRSLQARAAA